MKNIIKAIGGVIVFGLVLFANFIKFPYNLILASLSAVFFYFYEAVIATFEDFQKKNKELKKIRGVISELNKFLIKYTALSIENEKVLVKELYRDSELDFSRINISKKIFQKFEKLEDMGKDILQIFFIVDLISRETDKTKISGLYKESISQILAGYNFLSDEELIENIARSYNNYKQSRHLDFMEKDLNKSVLFDEFTNKYCRAEFLAFKLRLDKDQAEELRRTLAIMYTKGKLSVKQLGKDIFNNINKALNEEMQKTKIYLFISNYNWRGEVDEFLKKIPHLKFGRVYPNELPSNLKFLHMRILYTSGKYTSMKNFLEKEIVSRIPRDERGEGYVCLIPIDGGEMISYPEKIESIRNVNSRKSYNELKSIRTGHNFNILNIVLDNIDFNEEKSVGNLLSIIPFNIFVPKIKDNEKAFIISNYEKLREEFSITELTDWGNIKDSKKLADKIIELDKNSEKRTCDDDRWIEISDKIIKEAVKHKNAIEKV